MSVEMVFRDIDADGIVRHLSLVLCLSSAAKLRVSVQASRKDEGDQTLTRPVTRSAFHRSDPRRRREGWHPLPAVLSRPFGSESHKTSMSPESGAAFGIKNAQNQKAKAHGANPKDSDTLQVTI
jgi:hypothetical protein